MPYGTSQVVGLIEMDAGLPLNGDQLLETAAHRQAGPPPRVRRQRLSPPTPSEAVPADLDQINEDLRVELARLVTRIAARRR